MQNIRSNISLQWFLLVALMGVVLRAMQVFEVPLSYTNVLHAHSHIAFLGWVFTALFTLISAEFLQDKFSLGTRLNRQFRFAQLSAAGMFISFLFQGYGPVSIFFCTLHMCISTWFAVSAYFACRKEEGRLPVSVKFLFAALGFMILSSFGPLSLPLISKFAGRDSSYYANAIYFYLHFQYNGWFILALLALLFRQLEKKNLKFPKATADILFYTLSASCLMTYFLSVLWTKPHDFIWFIAMSGALIQMFSLFAFVIIIVKTKFDLSPQLKRLGTVVVIAFSVKIILQLLSSFPFFAQMGSSIRHFIIAYLHLVVLGVVSLSILGYYITLGWIKISSHFTKAGLLIFIIAFIFSETMAVSEGFFNYVSKTISGYNLIQFYAALTMFTGITCIYLGRRTVLSLNANRIYKPTIHNNPKYQYYDNTRST